MKFNFKLLILYILLLVPALGLAQVNGILPNCGADCNFSHLMELAKNIMNFIFIISIPLSAIAFVWAGFIYITAQGNESKISKAHSIFVKVGVGLIFVMTAWLIVYLISTTLIETDYILIG